MKDLLRLGAMEDAAFIEPELAFCLQNFAASGGVMEAVCRVQVCACVVYGVCVACVLRFVCKRIHVSSCLFLFRICWWMRRKPRAARGVGVRQRLVFSHEIEIFARWLCGARERFASE